MKKKHFKNTMVLLFVLGVLAGCTKSKPDITIANLKLSLISENTTHTKYLAFSEKAVQDGYLQISKLFKALATAEGVHAKNFRNILVSTGEKFEDTDPTSPVESTEKNLQNAIKEEIMDIDSIYPLYIKQSENSLIKQANQTFSYTWEAEKTHKNLLVMIYDVLMTKVEVNKKGLVSAPSGEKLPKIEELFSSTEYYVCPVDGRVYDNSNVPDKCRLCLTPKENFIIIK